jgi:alpha/beta superfamily hydrolase
MEVAFSGPVGRLMGVLELPEGEPRAVAIVCHPHPLHGGTAGNTIVVRTARALRKHGLVTLRFHFRGVEGSEGEHHGTAEVEDAEAALAWLSERHPGLPLWVAGYSFGSRIVSELALRLPDVERVILVAFPCRLWSPAFLARLTAPGLLVLAGEDEFGTLEDLRRGLPDPPAGLEVQEIAGADHFFRGRTPLVEAAVERYARQAFEAHRQP